MAKCYKILKGRRPGTSRRTGAILWDANKKFPGGSHLMGFFYRTIRMAENGIKPVYVFDGKPPELKSGVVSAICLKLRGASGNTQVFS